jgi:pyruvate-ferredoxin/flavodoxin oxidoreductase
VYSNTGGQASKSTPRGALAKFAARGKATGKKDLGLMAMAYGNVYVAQIALGANDMQTVRSLLEAEAWGGPSLVIAYSTCIAHGIEMATSMSHQRDAVRSGYWPLYRFNPGAGEHDHPFHLDAKAPSIPLEEFTGDEARFALLARSDPEGHRRLMRLAEEDVRERRRFHEQLAGIERSAPALPEPIDETHAISEEGEAPP